MRKWLIVLAVLIVIAVGILFVGGTAPAVSVAAETIFHIGPLAVTNTMLTSWIVVIVVAALGIGVGRSLKLVPSGFSGAVEAGLIWFYDICVLVAGEKNGRRFFPVCATIFCFIVVANYMGLLPVFNVIGHTDPGHGMSQPIMQQADVAGVNFAYIPLKPQTVDTRNGETPLQLTQPGGKFSGVVTPVFRSAMTDVNAPLAIAIWSAIFVEFWGFQDIGLGYLTKFFNFKNLLRIRRIGLLDVFVGILELISELARLISFTFRLFGNTFGGDVVLMMATFMIPFVVAEVFYGLELFEGLVQAFIFAMLTLVFAHTAVTFSHGNEHGEEHATAH